MITSTFTNVPSFVGALLHVYTRRGNRPSDKHLIVHFNLLQHIYSISIQTFFFPFGRLVPICKVITSSFIEFNQELGCHVKHVVIKNNGGLRWKTIFISASNFLYSRIQRNPQYDERGHQVRSDVFVYECVVHGALQTLTLYNALVDLSGGRVGHFVEERPAFVTAPCYPRVQWHLS